MHTMCPAQKGKSQVFRQLRYLKMDCIYINLIVVLLLTQGYISESQYCPEAVASVETAISCPTSRKELDIAAGRKNCSKLATGQNCTKPEHFVYHCTINTYRNATLEVCAPTKYILGHCTEFNIVGGVIQAQHYAPCNTTSFPKCDDVYISSDAYKYDDCYKLVNAARDLQTEAKKEKKEMKKVIGDTEILFISLGVFGVVVMVFVCGAVIFKVLHKNSQQKKTETMLHQKELKQVEDFESQVNLLQTVPSPSSPSNNDSSKEGAVPPLSSPSNNDSSKEGAVPPLSSPSNNDSSKEGAVPPLSSPSNNDSSKEGAVPPLSSPSNNDSSKEGAGSLLSLSETPKSQEVEDFKKPRSFRRQRDKELKLGLSSPTPSTESGVYYSARSSVSSDTT